MPSSIFGMSWIVALVLALLPAICASGEEHVDGAAFLVPETWQRQSVPATAAAWADRQEPATPRSLQVDVRAEYTPASPANTRKMAANLRRRLANLSGIRSPHVHEVRYVEVAGFPGYRLRVGLEKDGRALEQLIYVVGGDKTFVFTFCTSREAYAADEPEFEAVLQSLRLTTSLAVMSPWACVLMLGGCAGLGTALRCRRSVMNRST